nr:immunoglobulin lambda-1 light chain-like [Maylandia zebra]
MLWTLCTLITALTYVDAVIVLTQTPSVHTVSPGQEVVLNCNIERYDANYVSWYKQVPGTVPQSKGNKQGSRKIYTGRRRQMLEEIPGNTGKYTRESRAYTKGGSSLSLPVLTVFPPSSAELQSDTASLVCLSSQSVPFADVSWLAGGSPVSSEISTSTAVQRPDQTYQISSSLTIQTSEWNMDKVYTCKVSLGSETSEKTIKMSECPSE